MKRRELLMLLGGAAAFPLATAAQPTKMARVGVLMSGNPDPGFFSCANSRKGCMNWATWRAATSRWNCGMRADQPPLRSLARELVALKVDAIVGFQTPSVVTAKEATTEVPIVMGPAADPIGTGLVASFARPGGNITGVTTATAELAGKNLDLIREVLPAVRRVGVIGNSIDPFHKPFLEYVASAARALNFETKIVLTQGGDHLVTAFAELAKSGVEAAIIQPSSAARTGRRDGSQKSLAAVRPKQ